MPPCLARPHASRPIWLTIAVACTDVLDKSLSRRPDICTIQERTLELEELLTRESAGLEGVKDKACMWSGRPG